MTQNSSLQLLLDLYNQLSRIVRLYARTFHRRNLPKVSAFWSYYIANIFGKVVFFLPKLEACFNFFLLFLITKNQIIFFMFTINFQFKFKCFLLFYQFFFNICIFLGATQRVVTLQNRYGLLPTAQPLIAPQSNRPPKRLCSERLPQNDSLPRIFPLLEPSTIRSVFKNLFSV